MWQVGRIGSLRHLGRLPHTDAFFTRRAAFRHDASMRDSDKSRFHEGLMFLKHSEIFEKFRNHWDDYHFT